MKKIIITGAPRTGTTALSNFLSHSSNILVTNELGTFHPDTAEYHKRKDSILNDSTNQRYLELKKLTKKDIDDFYLDNFKNKDEIEFFGDKHTTYCSDFYQCAHLVKNYPDAYFIFTHRSLLAIAFSEIKRTAIEKDENADWFFTTYEESAKKSIFSTLNWATNIFPFVKNKIIIDYDNYIGNVNALVNDLNVFLNTKLDIFEPEKLYFHPHPKAYKGLTNKNRDANGVARMSNVVDGHIRSLIYK